PGVAPDRWSRVLFNPPLNPSGPVRVVLAPGPSLAPVASGYLRWDSVPDTTYLGGQGFHFANAINQDFKIRIYPPSGPAPTGGGTPTPNPQETAYMVKFQA